MSDVPAGPPPTGPPAPEGPPASTESTTPDEPEPPALFWFYVIESVPTHRSDGSVLGQLDPGNWYPAHEEAGEWTSTTDALGRSGWVDGAAVNQAPLTEPPGQQTPQPSPVPEPEGPPAPAAPAAKGATPPGKRHGCRRLFLVAVAVVVVVGIGAFLLVRSGYVSLTALQARLSGVGSITVVNTTDDELRVRVTSGDDVTDSTTIESLDIDGFGALEPGSYTVEFEAATGAPPTLECSLDLSRGQDYQFVAVPEGIAVTVGDFAEDVDEVDAATSSLCGR